MIKEAISKVIEGEDLSIEMAQTVMNEIMTGQATHAEMASFLTAMRMKTETIDEITACAIGMRNHCTQLQHEGDVLEIVGTGGDKAFTFNISTVSSFIISAAGIPVAKHGNRSVSSKCGAADVLEALGVNITIPPEKSEKILKEIGICFLFAQTYHTSMKYVAPVRKELGVRTIFNILGPLSNPAQANLQLLGVYDEKLIEPLARVLHNLGVKRAMVVCGGDGLDEITLTTATKVCEIREDELKNYTFNPEEYGFTLCRPEDLVGGTPEVNKQIALDILSGVEKGAKRDAVILNAGACIYLGRDNTTLAQSFEIAREVLDSGKAYEQLQKFIKLSNE